jgi:hypothetical protein
MGQKYNLVTDAHMFGDEEWALRCVQETVNAEEILHHDTIRTGKGPYHFVTFEIDEYILSSFLAKGFEGTIGGGGYGVYAARQPDLDQLKAKPQVAIDNCK